MDMSPARSTRSSASTADDYDATASPILTPRSKIKAMLAQFDEDSSDDELAPKTTTARKPHKPSPKPVTSVSGSIKIPQPAGKRVNVVSPESEDEDEVVIKPRGTLAARMAASAAPAPFQEEASSEEEDEQNETVYQRIRKEMLAEKTQGLEPHDQADQVSAAQSPARDTPSPPRRRLALRAHQLAESPASTRSESPGLFMSPGPSRPEPRQRDDNDDHSSGSDSDLPSPEAMGSRLRQLVEKRRRERLANEASSREEKEDGAERALVDLFDDEEEEEVDPTTERRLTQQSRPTRKASKKALEEMNRETQRMSRNMQLTHQAKVKKRFTTADFLSRFGGRSKLAQVTNAADSSSVAAPESDGERNIEDTPPSSPPSVHEEQEKTSSQEPSAHVSMPPVDSDEELPDLETLGSSQYKESLAMAKPPLQPQSPKPTRQNKPTKKLSPRQYRIVPAPRPTQRSTQPDSDSDSDLEIIQGNRVAAIFESVEPSKASESRPLHVLRHLAHLHHNENPRRKKGERPSMTPGQLEIELRRRAKIQAIMEREEKLASLKARGIVVMTNEEREREQVVIENMLDKAREDAEKLRKLEKKAAKEAGLEEGGMIASSDESEDEDFVGSDEEAAGEDEEDVELSGSEDEEEEEIEGEDNGLVDDQAGEEDEGDDEEQVPEEADDIRDAMESIQDEEESTQAPTARRAPRRKLIVDDDDDDMDTESTSQPPAPTNAAINDDLAAAFGFAPAQALGVSQMFAGTMADTQDSMDATVLGDTYPDPDQDSFAMLRNIPSAPIPTFTPAEDSQDSIVVDSQTAREPTQAIRFNYTQLAEQQQTPLLNRTASISQYGDMDFTPSQDVGLKDKQTPLKKLDLNALNTTQETVLLDIPESPVVQQAQRRGRLVRRVIPAEDTSDNDEPAAEPVPSSNAFDRMRKAASKKPQQQQDFDKKASNAKTMVEEQAEESEDEYAGLGGASDDEHVDEEANEADKAMIDHSDIAVNERELAAFYAEKARKDNEAQTSKLYKDLMSGGLRRRQGAGGAFDLDSDEDEVENERRRRRQREEARKRRLLLQMDESVGKLGTNSKKEAFLRAIEDREDDFDDMEVDLLDGHDIDEDAPPADSQMDEGGENSTQPLNQTSHNSNSLKRKADNSAQGPSSQGSTSRKRPSLGRRNPLAALRAPRSLQEVRDSVSFLIDDATSIDPNANGTIFSDDEDQAAPERAPASERRTVARGVVDRLTLKKQASSLMTEAGSAIADGNMAFAAPSLKSVGSFTKIPSLLRRATTNLGNDSTSMPPPPRKMGGREDSTGSGVRMGGSKKSSINYQAREAERRLILEKAEKKRKEEVRKVAGMRRKGSSQAMLGAFGGASGGFE